MAVYRPLLQILTLFQTKKCNFPHTFPDLASEIHTHFQTGRWSKNATLQQGPEEMCLSEREETNLGPIFESLKLKWKLNETCPFFLLGSCALVALRTTCCAPQGYGLRLLIFKVANNKVDLGQIRSEEIVYSRFIKIPLG